MMTEWTSYSHFCTLAVEKRHHPVYCRPADGAFLWRWQDVIALGTGTHVATVEKHQGPLPAQADSTAGGRHAAFFYVEFTHAFLLLLLELLEHASLLLALSVVHVSLPQDEEERGTRGDAEDDGQNPPQPDAVPLLPEKRLVVQPSEKVAEALFGRLELDQVVIQDQFAYACDAVFQPQHLLRFVDALGALPANEVANNVGQGLDRGVEVFVCGLQVQLGSI